MKYFDDDMYFMGGTPRMQYAPGGVTLTPQQYAKVKALYGSPTANQNPDLWDPKGVRKIASQLGLDPSVFSQGSDFVDLMRNYERKQPNKPYVPTPVSKGKPSPQAQRRMADEKAYEQSQTKGDLYKQPAAKPAAKPVAGTPARQLQNTPPAKTVAPATPQKAPVTLNSFLQENGYGTDATTKRQIASALGLNYTGGADDNIKILNALQKLEGSAASQQMPESQRRIATTLQYAPGAVNTNESIVDYLNSVGMDASKDARRKYAEVLGMADYGKSGTITAEDNMKLMQMFKQMNSPQNYMNYAPLDDIQMQPGSIDQMQYPSEEQVQYEQNLLMQRYGGMNSQQSDMYFAGGEIENDPHIMSLYGFANGGQIMEIPVAPYGYAQQGMQIPVAPYGYNQQGGMAYEDGGQMPTDIAVARFKAAAKEKGLSGGEAMAYVEKMKSKYNYQGGGAVKERPLNEYELTKFGNGGIMYNGTKFPGYNKPVNTSPDDKYKKMMVLEKGGKIKLVKYGLK